MSPPSNVLSALSLSATPARVASADSIAGQRVHIICYHLPMMLQRDDASGQWTAEWDDSIIAKTPDDSVSDCCEVSWVGTVRCDQIRTDADREAVRRLLRTMNCTPIFLHDDTDACHYLGMCKQVLWPAFHNIDQLDLSDSGYDAVDGTTFHSTEGLADEEEPGHGIASDWDQGRLGKWWEAYERVNQIFADAVLALLKPGDTLWVHDYHLALLPKLVDASEQTRFGRRRSRIVFFLHIPFPTSQIFRELECGVAILTGMLHADVIGFHAFDHARHFLNAVKRILGLNYESRIGGLIGVQYRGTTVMVTMSHVSVEPSILNTALEIREVHTGSRAIKEKHPNQIVVCGVDTAQKLSGVALKLLAYERLLADYPTWHRRAVLVQRMLVPGNRPTDERRTLLELRALVRRIRESFGPEVIDYSEVRGSVLPLHERLSLWLASDVFFATTLREGLNLLPLEYVYARKAPATPGVVITSEFSAVCAIMNGAIRVNPYDVQMTVGELERGLSMGMAEREGRRVRDIEFISSRPSGMWTKNVLRDLNEAVDSSGKETIDLEVTTSHELNDITFSHAHMPSIKEAYDSTEKRILIMDFGGTLVKKDPVGKYLKSEISVTSGRSPKPKVINALKRLCADPRNTVFVVSGLTKDSLIKCVGSIEGLGLAACNGSCFSWPVQNEREGRIWNSFEFGVNWEAVKQIALPIMSKFTARTNGSIVNISGATVSWSYYSCDPEWGALQASYLVPELTQSLRGFDVRFLHLKGSIEIVPKRLNKGVVVRKILRDVSAGRAGNGRSGPPDFMLCMGDDVSDERMFTSLFSFIADTADPSSVLGANSREESQINPMVIPDQDYRGPAYRPIRPHPPPDSDRPQYAFTITVGKKASQASQFVHNASEVEDLLDNLSGGDSIENLGGTNFQGEDSGINFFE